METLLRFITALAWIFGVMNTIGWVLCVVISIRYEGSIEQKLDRIQGKELSFNFKRMFIIALICWVWIYSRS